MGQKVNPNIMRLGIIKTWNSSWISNNKNFSNILYNDYLVRKYLEKKLFRALVSNIIIERPAKSIKITIYTARPGIVIGKKGEDVDKLRKKIKLITGVPCQVSIFEIRKPELDAFLVSRNIAVQLERRIMFRRVIKRCISNAMRLGAKGIKIKVSGRLSGVEIARKEWYKEGRVPLHTLRANINYGFSEAFTNYGVIGIKVWIFKGEILDKYYLVKNISRVNINYINKLLNKKKL